MRRLSLSVVMLTAAAAHAAGQDATIVYRMGRDTVAVERFRHTTSRMVGETLVRHGDIVLRTKYDVVIRDGRVASAVIEDRHADGSPIAGVPIGWRLTFGKDSAIRETVWRDSVQRKSFATPSAFFLLPIVLPMPMPQAPPREVFQYSHALFELLVPGGTPRDSTLVIPLRGDAPRMVSLERLSGDTVHMRGGHPSAEWMRFDGKGRLLWTYGASVVGTRESKMANIAVLSAKMKPTGVVSPRGTAYAEFDRGPIFINYGRPSTRGRSVWGGVLVPFDTVWRTGANEATHLATSKTIVLGELTLTPGLYTLWTQYTRSGTFLIVNRQVGQWGTSYDSTQNIGRVPMAMAPIPSRVEQFTITVRATTPHRGAFDFAWGDSVATVEFTVKQ
jgi:hypothetical protein